MAHSRLGLLYFFAVLVPTKWWNNQISSHEEHVSTSRWMFNCLPLTLLAVPNSSISKWSSVPLTYRTTWPKREIFGNTKLYFPMTLLQPLSQALIVNIHLYRWSIGYCICHFNVLDKIYWLCSILLWSPTINLSTFPTTWTLKLRPKKRQKKANSTTVKTIQIFGQNMYSTAISGSLIFLLTDFTD